MQFNSTEALSSPRLNHQSQLVNLGYLKISTIGAASGFLATVIKSLCEVISPPRAPDVLSPLGNLIEFISKMIVGHKIADPLKHIEIVSHFAFGTSAGLFYCILAEKNPKITLGCGILFGVIFWFLVHEIFMPLLGLSPSPLEMTLWEQGNELISHCVFGFVLEVTRRWLKK